jgi:hypothetical protein
MEQELYQYLTTLSNKQLLKILEEPHEYTPEAIVTIRKILLSRNITKEEEDIIHKELMLDVFEEHKQKELFEQKWKPLITVYNFIKQPSLIKDDKYLHLFLLLLLVIYYLIFLQQRLSFLYYEINHTANISLFFAAINFIQLISTPFVINLLNKKQSFGWVLSNTGKITELVYTLCFWLSYWGNYSYVSTIAKVSIFLHVLLLTGILVCLNYKQTKQIFGTSKSLQKKTILGGIVLGLLYYFILTIIYRR